jgi:isoleucyl-tRNA synthetase
MTNMIAMRPDWCISRQRVWGVPIVVFYCEACTLPYTDADVQRGVVEQFRQHTSDVWYSKSAEELMGPGHRCPRCEGTRFRKETDILDVWFDSGSSHLAVLTGENALPWPADMYIEGGDQYRGWFHSSLLIGVGLKGEAPYRECATHGWTLDADGRAMHKSLGNTIEPEKIVTKYGADLLRLWVGSVDFTEDVRLSDTILTRLSEAYRKLRNTFRYMLGNLNDFDPTRDAVPGAQLLGIDSWILTRAEELVTRCLAYYSEYAFHKVYRAIYEFSITDLSAIYFDVSKDRLYTSGPSSPARRSGQTALHRLNLALARLLAPILSFTCEEAWEHSSLPIGAQPNVHMDLFPAPGDLTAGITFEQQSAAADWDKLAAIRDQVLKSLDLAREDKIIGSSLEAAVALQAAGETLALLTRYEAELPGLFIVSAVELAAGAEALTIQVERARGDKCDRCWKYTLDVGSDPEYPTVCASCAKTLREYF